MSTFDIQAYKARREARLEEWSLETSKRALAEADARVLQSLLGFAKSGLKAGLDHSAWARQISRLEKDLFKAKEEERAASGTAAYLKDEVSILVQANLALSNAQAEAQRRVEASPDIAGPAMDLEAIEEALEAFLLALDELLELGEDEPASPLPPLNRQEWWKIADPELRRLFMAAPI